MTQSRKAHIISHTHWDREWYLPYEKHHVRLIELMDTLLETMEKEPEYRYFFLDGQTIILDDYLQVRPEKKEQLDQLIHDGRIQIGPWYILQDAFLTSSEANVRNMQIGHEDAAKYGTVSKIGYFPDTFGLAGQTPQLMVQSGIDNAFFGRGVKPTGFNNTVSDGGYESSFSELTWQGPDGSKVLGILFANWYSNGNEVPADEEEAKAYWERKLADAEKYASTGQLLYMNGCDHQPIQTDLPEAIQTAGKLYHDTEFVHSTFDQYLDELRQHLGQELSTVEGELRSQRTDGWGTLVNTASARVYLKQMNQTGQSMLEKVAEPLASMASLAGQEYPHHLFTYAWKTLMQNHPHDSICGCSVDEVHREMVTRFEKSRHVAENIADDSKAAIANVIDTSAFSQWGEGAVPFVVFNTTGWKRTGTVTVTLDAERLYFRDGYSLKETAERMKQVDLSGMTVVDEQGRPVLFTLEDLGLQFGYDLPDDRFRQPYMCRRVKVTLYAANVPALGYQTLALVKGAAASSHDSSLFRSDRIMENDALKVELNADGSFTLTDKLSGQVYRDQGIFENTGDIGNEYMFKQPEGEEALSTKGLEAQITVVEDSPFRASLQVMHEWDIPVSADDKLLQEQIELIYYPERKAQRASETITLKLKTVITLERDAKGVQMSVTFNNQSKDHRLRVWFPTDLQTAVHRADSMFEVAERSNEPAAEWENPSNTAHQQAFVDVSGESAGLTVANLGLNEYEVLRDGRNTIAVTLLRAVGELGDWGYFPTPEAQCIGESTVHLEVIPHQGSGIQDGAFAQAYQFQVPWAAVQTGVHEGKLPASYSMFTWEHPQLAFSSLKMNRDSGDWMLRWFNLGGEAAELELGTALAEAAAYKTTILEQKQEEQQVFSSTQPLQLTVKPYEIVTVGVQASSK
ncbi:glycosyl hydrolase family 38 N-terminal domain protein [Paenibacillus algicola]|uniref:Glycosyl hydrolase family 38 N-terminal domain protein n=1 Tax=Paenibacillus algicola TaxID=2565926 RepID=A0A4P8XIY3_9BACL|nr:alpha-mannosidase [Paenibacillus algicola]QCT02308.1 glycosyl hydrolase family 38 N-terminal domain protein [Paenibacillus algicola]